MDNLIVSEQNIQSRIYTIRGVQVMLDSDLASMYHIETKTFNQAVKRNLKRFPEHFRFQLTKEEYEYIFPSFPSSSLGMHTSLKKASNLHSHPLITRSADQSPTPDRFQAVC
jgi:hypothetical protein